MNKMFKEIGEYCVRGFLDIDDNFIEKLNDLLIYHEKSRQARKKIFCKPTKELSDTIESIFKEV